MDLLLFTVSETCIWFLFELSRVKYFEDIYIFVFDGATRESLNWWY